MVYGAALHLLVSVSTSEREKRRRITNKINFGVSPENMCDRLENIANGRVILSGTFVGAVANYSCDLGYTLDGNVLRECQSSGQWTGSEPTCNSK